MNATCAATMRRSSRGTTCWRAGRSSVPRTPSTRCVAAAERRASLTIGLYQAGVERVDDRLGPVAEPEFREDAADVRLHGRLAHDQVGADLGVRRAGSDQLEDLALSGREQLELRARHPRG